MKKTLALILALCMVFALSACGGTPAELTTALDEIEANPRWTRVSEPEEMQFNAEGNLLPIK